MSTNTSSQPQGEPPFPSFNELRSAGTPVGLSPAARRLHWTLTGDYPSAISVMKTKHYDGQLDAFFRLDEGATGSGNWHEIATLPLTEPKVSSIEASLLDLEQWESDWMAWHADHSAPGFGQIYWTYADLSDDDRPFRDEPDEDGNWEADSDTEFLVSCCGDDRPLRKKGLKITVTPSAGSNFVSVRDYVSGKLVNNHGVIDQTLIGDLILTIYFSGASVVYGTEGRYPSVQKDRQATAIFRISVRDPVDGQLPAGATARDHNERALG